MSSTRATSTSTRPQLVVEAWAQAAEEAGSLEPQAVIASLHEHQFETVGGAIDFDEKGDLQSAPAWLGRCRPWGTSELGSLVEQPFRGRLGDWRYLRAELPDPDPGYEWPTAHALRSRLLVLRFDHTGSGLIQLARLKAHNPELRHRNTPL